MNLILLLFMQAPSLPAYQAPSMFEAHDSFNRRIESQILEARAGGSTGTAVDTSPQWAVDFRISECVWGREQNLNPALNNIPDNNGYFCRFSVFPLGALDYSDFGFFTHDGFQWRFFGRTREADSGRDTQLPRDKVVRSQPFVDSPYLSGSYYDYDLSGVRVLDNTPYVRPGEGYIRIDPYSKRSSRSDRVITAYEKDDHRRRRDMEDYVRHPKGTPERNKKGY
ncbi:hypothetical protein [Parvularcula sp. IMCC14364]|uniref:hypothetical protein n=1 Tax=Parvularcula sp. IMCC14364 TaxID=3067902 RepID=UPI0027427638|nr:hypothetical protein [Parvularcula sp. IMCC14364]